MKRVAKALAVSRSNLAERAKSVTQSRGTQLKAEDEVLLPIIRRFVDERPTYGYRRITALVNRERAKQGMPPANRKRVHRIMQRHALLLEPHTGRREGRTHDGKVMVMCSNLRWCSDGLEFACWNGEIVRMALLVPGLYVCGLGLALLVRRTNRFNTVMRSMFFAPQMVSLVVIAVIWQLLRSDKVGLVARLFTAIGISGVSILCYWRDPAVIKTMNPR